MISFARTSTTRSSREIPGYSGSHRLSLPLVLLAVVLLLGVPGSWVCITWFRCPHQWLLSRSVDVPQVARDLRPLTETLLKPRLQ
eukprot:1220475-Rhodomonas_salina.2